MILDANGEMMLPYDSMSEQQKREFEQEAVGHHYMFLDAAVRQMRHWVELSRKAWTKHPVVTHDGHKILLTNGNKVMPIDPAIIGMAAGMNVGTFLHAALSQWKLVCMRL